MADATGTAFLETLVGFGRALRAAGLPVGTGDVQTYCAAMEPLDPTDLLDLYWAGRTTLVGRREHLPVYHRVFREWFLGVPGEPDEARPFNRPDAPEAWADLQLPEPERSGEEREQQEAPMGLVGSDVATLRAKSFADCTPDELAALRRIMRTVRLTPPRRRSRRTAPAVDGRRPDLRRTVREALRTHGDPATLRWRERRVRPRRLVLVLDVSGSMADYSRALLQFAHVTSRAARRVEVFCFGTRLTRITRELEHRRPDDALARAADAVVDWEGGTRIGASLDAFVREWGRRGIGRGGIVVICSDGLDRGDPALLESAMRRLARRCHRVVWLSPHAGSGSPPSLGMTVATPYVDRLLPARDLDDLERFARTLAVLG
ncbi:VWA domain-containing protein [Nocardioides sp. LMS-CY]|uniref:vWA domain-containing protein n=1 Tax=Nocardioides sp. (strain LMS-CY) TaxID=2840457 RepID=UPI001C006138|nr:VWA domain-containing protein [Nocardioides sp. LMS-CY]QWF22548.1 VWA domain-containing protein [Nocardioides sp. LMS-CY]